MDLPSVILVAAIVLVLASLELLAYAVPIRIRLQADFANDRGSAFISACWLCLGVRCTLSREGPAFHLLLGGVLLPLPASPGRDAPGSLGREDNTLQEPQALTISSYIQTAVKYLPEIISFARTTLRSLSFKRLDCRAVVGLSGPAETGMLYGYFWAVRPLLCRNGRTNLELIPDFTKEHLEGHLELDAGISYPFTLVARLARLYLLFQEEKRSHKERMVTA
ncbi:MAG: hypothetical protein A4E37_01783 [Methanoregulaceae archaeon PtaB.Bin056]|jgi:hypothetical protein|nr:MAG: hypothetical protein A4E37_01783 [Methanoregulaceae archaeon PtaB.Bin056]